MIEVKRKSEQKFVVTIKERGIETEHVVTLDDEYYQHLTDGEMTREELIEMSFKFLLEREPKESILSRFNLKVINSYFPEFEKKTRR